MIDELRGFGWMVTERHPRGVSEDLVVVDGLVGVADPAPYRDAVVLLHMPFAEAFPDLEDAERELLWNARAVVTTSEWARDWVVARYELEPQRVTVATPGVDEPPWSRDGRCATSSTNGGGNLLCVGPVTHAKGHDILFAALEQVADLDWTCRCVGALEPEFVALLHGNAVRDRVELTGPLSEEALEAVYADADLLVSASRHESYGMAVTEALARGIPVLVSDVGGHPEAVGHATELLARADDPDTLAEALRRWLTDPATREEVRAAAAVRRTTLRSWTDTARDLEAVLR